MSTFTSFKLTDHRPNTAGGSTFKPPGAAQGIPIPSSGTLTLPVAANPGPPPVEHVDAPENVQTFEVTAHGTNYHCTFNAIVTDAELEIPPHGNPSLSTSTPGVSGEATQH